MATYADKITLQELIELVRQNDIDVPEMQRTFAEKPSWVVHLVDSLYHDIPIGQVLIWLPDDAHRPTAGRYQRNSGCSRWILDGQQRITALLAALEMRPPWIPEDRWNRMVHEPLQVAIGARRDGQLTFRPLRTDVAGEVALGDLLVAEQITHVLGPTDVVSADIIQKYCALREKLLNSEIALAYLPGDYRTAALGFARRNQKSSATPFMTEDTAERIIAHGGWNVGAYEELRCSEATLAAQSIPPPQPHIPSREIGSWLLKNRAAPLAGRIERYRRTVGALSAHV